MNIFHDIYILLHILRMHSPVTYNRQTDDSGAGDGSTGNIYQAKKCH